MANYKESYFLLFNAITDALESLGRLDIPVATRLLEDAQAEAEDRFLEKP